MLEQISTNLETKAISNRDVYVSQMADLQHYGSPESVLQRISTDVSSQIDAYLETHPGKMLPQTPEALAAQFRAGRSLVTLSEDGAEVLFHATRYPMYGEDVEKYSGVIVEELGSVISKYEGMGFATRGCREMVNHVCSLELPTLMIATIKRRKMAMAFNASGISTDNYHALPYLAYLTCTCPECSERSGHGVCPFRRSIAASRPELLLKLTDKSDHSADETDCTLLVSDPKLARAVNLFFQEDHQKMSGFCVFPGEINHRTMQQCQDYFAKVASYAKQ